MKRHDCTEWEGLIEAMNDGELTASELSRLEHELTQCASCRARLQALTEMRGLVRMSIQDAVDSAPFDSLWSGIQAGIEAQPVELTPLELQALADGELQGRSLVSVMNRLASCQAGHRQLEAIAEMGDLLRASAEQTVESVDFDRLWQRLDKAVGREIEARGELRIAPASSRRESRIGWFDRILAAVGGYRSILMSAATAAIVALILVPILNRGGMESTMEPGATPTWTQTVTPWQSQPQQLEIRVVHVNEVVSNPGHQVTVDSYDGYAPVIYIRSEEDRDEPTNQANEPVPRLFPDPI